MTRPGNGVVIVAVLLDGVPWYAVIPWHWSVGEISGGRNGCGILQLSFSRWYSHFFLLFFFWA